MAYVFLYLRQRLSSDQVRIAVEGLPRCRRDEHGRGWFLGRSTTEAFVYHLDERTRADHNMSKSAVRRHLSPIGLFRRRINTALAVYTSDRPAGIFDDFASPIVLQPDRTALEHARILAHRLKSHGIVVIHAADSGEILRVRPSDYSTA